MICYAKASEERGILVESKGDLLHYESEKFIQNKVHSKFGKKYDGWYYISQLLKRVVI